MSEQAKGIVKICQVRIKEMSASELSMRYRNDIDFVKTMFRKPAWDKCSGYLFTGCAANGIEIA